MRTSNSKKLSILAAALPFAMFACSSNERSDPKSPAGVTGGSATTTGGVTSSGGQSTGGSLAQTGGAVGTGGGASVSGGSGGTVVTTGGTSAGGTLIGTGGAVIGTGGVTQAAGGARVTGGAPAMGGALVTGGAPSMGGALVTGGALTMGGALATGGAPDGTGGTPTTDVDKYFRDWPPGADPLTVGKKAAEIFLAQNLPTGSGESTEDDYKHYKDACAWYGALSVAALVGDQSLTNGLVAKYEPYKNTWSAFDPPTTQNPYQGHVDNNVFGIVPLEIAKLDSDPIYLQEGDLPADHQVAFIDAQIRWAIDDMFMITSLQVQAYRIVTDEEHRMRHLDTAAETMALYLDTMQKEENGLFPHHRDNPDFQISWGRGNGWYAAGMAEMIRELPPGHDYYQPIYDGYKAMMDGLLQYQIPQGQSGAGLWKQVVDSSDQRNWAETSGSAMFAYALVSGVRHGWLDVEAYGPAARDAWLGLVAKVNDEGRIQDISDWAYLPSSHSGGPTYAGDEENYYFERPRLTGDNHGQAPLMWTAAALARPLE